MKDNLQTFRMTKSGPQKGMQRAKSTVYHTHNYQDTNKDCRTYKKDMFEPRGLLELEQDLYHKVSVLKKRKTINELQRLLRVKKRHGKGT